MLARHIGSVMPEAASSTWDSQTPIFSKGLRFELCLEQNTRRETTVFGCDFSPTAMSLGTCYTVSFASSIFRIPYDGAPVLLCLPLRFVAPLLTAMRQLLFFHLVNPSLAFYRILNGVYALLTKEQWPLESWEHGTLFSTSGVQRNPLLWAWERTLSCGCKGPSSLFWSLKGHRELRDNATLCYGLATKRCRLVAVVSVSKKNSWTSIFCTGAWQRLKMTANEGYE